MQHTRILKIYEYLQRNQSATVAELAELLSVSAVTVRKDLAVMEKNGQIIKGHGGATLADGDASLKNDKETICRFSHALEKTTDIARQFVQPGDFIYLGSGRTCLSLAEKIKDVKNISVITNNVTAVSILYPKVKNIILVGGECVSEGALVHTVDSNIESALNGIYFNKAFSSGIGIDIDAGLTVNTMGSIFANRVIPSLCSDWYIMMDSSKFGIKAFYQAARLEQIHCMITDLDSPEILRDYRQKGVSVIAPDSQRIVK